MKLIIDAGNTATKLAVFDKDKMIYKQVTKSDSIARNIMDLTSKFPDIQNAILCTVSKIKENSIQLSLNKVPLLILNYNTPLPFVNKYISQKTLGSDRLALVAAAVKMYNNRNCLIIDAGTCVTYDFLNSDNEYQGGSISPGLQLRYNSLHNYTENLPLLSPVFSDNLIGKTTESAIHSGVSLGLISEIKGIIDQFSNMNDSLVVILTGGSADFLSKRLKNSIFVQPNFLTQGLNYILDYNTNK